MKSRTSMITRITGLAVSAALVGAANAQESSTPNYGQAGFNNCVIGFDPGNCGVPPCDSILPKHVDKFFDKETVPLFGDGPRCVAICDVNLDGVNDIITANANANNVSVALGSITSGPGFEPFYVVGSPTNFATGANPETVICAEINCDSNPDLITTNLGDDTLTLLTGDGAGNFNSKTIDLGSILGTSLGINDVDAKDLDADGDRDLVVTFQQIDGVFVLLNNGDGTFGEDANCNGLLDSGEDSNANNALDIGSYYEVGFLPLGLEVCDINGDGKEDLAVANGLSNDVSILLGNGNGTFGEDTDGNGVLALDKFDLVTKVIAAVNTVINMNLDPMMFVDVIPDTGGEDDNGNGQLDVVFTTVDVGSFPTDVKLCDFNCDGIKDLVTVNQGSGFGGGSISVAFGNGDGTFGSVQTLLGSGELVSPTALECKDVDLDGVPDIIVGDLINVSVVLGRETLSDAPGSFFFDPELCVVAAGGEMQCLASADLDNDGSCDVVVPKTSADEIRVLSNNLIVAPKSSDTAEDCILIDQGETAVLTCDFGGSPMAVQWFRNGAPIQNGGRFRTEQTATGSTLTIMNVSASDTDTYSCQAINEAGTASESTILAVRQPCDVERNGDGSLDVLDLLDYVNDYFNPRSTFCAPR